MYEGQTIGVVIPAYNEEGFVGDVIRELPAYVDRIYVVDDCSTDGTWEEVVEAAREDSARSTEYAPDRAIAPDGGTSALTERAIPHDAVGRVVPIQHRSNRGAGGAIKTGYLAAVEDRMDVTVTVDADGQMDLAQMRRLLEPIVDGRADYAKGNRLLSREYREAMPRFRLFGNSILTFLTKIASGYWKTMDPQNGYTAISHEALCAVDVESLYEYYGYCNELLVRLNASGMRVADVAMPAVYGEEESSIEYTTYIRKVSWMLLSNFLWRLREKYLVRDFHPLALFYLFGAGTATLGVFSAFWLLFAWASPIGSTLLSGETSLLVFITGSVLVLFAMVFDMQENEHRELQVQ